MSYRNSGTSKFPLNEFKVCKYKINYLLILILLSKLNVVDETPYFNSYDEYVRKHPVVRLKSIPRANENVQIGDLKHHVFIYQPYKNNVTYRAFCAGSIISDTRVLSSAHCFQTNKKKMKRNIDNVRVVAGILHTLTNETNSDDNQQWKSISHIYSQKFFRFPAFNIAVLEIRTPWIFNRYVNQIPYTKWDQDFDGICIGTTVKSTKSWSLNKSLVTENMRLINRKNCEKILLRSCMYFYCTQYDTYKPVLSLEAEGGGLICYGTGDPAETEDGVLVGVTSLVITGLPTLHNRIGLFYDWVTDACDKCDEGCLSVSIFILFMVNK